MKKLSRHCINGETITTSMETCMVVLQQDVKTRILDTNKSISRMQRLKDEEHYTALFVNLQEQLTIIIFAFLA